MKIIPLIIFLFLNLAVYSQKVKELYPTLGHFVDLSLKEEQTFINNLKKCDELWAKYSNVQDLDSIPEKDKEFLHENCPETKDDYWQILGLECSWYCGGGQDTQTASSELKSKSVIDYMGKNAHDLSYKTAWIEGVPGYGIGEFLIYHFPPTNPRITTIIVVNGYVKSDKVWKENSRVKKLKLYINDQPFAILNLEDTKAEQTFIFEPIGINDRDDWEKLKAMPFWTMKFEILDVYKGDKFDDTAITEIYFDGIDVH